jgi:hypothetical protein
VAVQPRAFGARPLSHDERAGVTVRPAPHHPSLALIVIFNLALIVTFNLALIVTFNLALIVTFNLALIVTLIGPRPT